MKKNNEMKEYKKPTINIQQVVVEQLLAGESGGQNTEGKAKRNDFWADEDESYEASSTSDEWN